MIDLRPFCAWNIAALMRPVSQGCYTFATDSAIAVRVYRRADTIEFTAVDLCAIFDRHLPSTWHRPPRIDLPPPIAMMDLGATVSFRFGSFPRRYIRLMLALPNLMFGPPPAPREPLAFAFDGGVGLVMPWTQPAFSDIHVDVGLTGQAA